MASEFWVNAVSGMAETLFGLSPEATLILVSICISLGITISIVLFARDHEVEHKKELGFVSFFLIYGLTAFVGMVDLVLVLIPLLLMAGFYIFMRSREHE